MTRSSLHARSFRRIHLSVFRYRLTKNGFAGLKGPRLSRNKAWPLNQTDGNTLWRVFVDGLIGNWSSFRPNSMLEYFRPLWPKSMPYLQPNKHKKTYLLGSFGAAHTYIAHIRKCPGGSMFRFIPSLFFLEPHDSNVDVHVHSLLAVA